MVKNWDLARKHQFFIDLAKNLQENRSSIPSLRLFKGLIKDQKDRSMYNSSPVKYNNMNYNMNMNMNINVNLNINTNMNINTNTNMGMNQ